MTDAATLDKAIAQHARWKHYLRQAVDTGESDRTVAVVMKADQCEFGKWLSTLPPTERDNEHWRTIEELHRTFHKAAAHVLDLALSGRQSEAAAELAIRGSFTKASSELVVAITQWKRAILAE